MSTNRRIYPLWLLLGTILCGFCTEACTQSSYQIGFLPGMNLSTKLNGSYSIYFGAESRQSFVQEEFGRSSPAGYEHVLTDLSLLASKKLGLVNKMAIGYQMRLSDGEVIHRAIQQFSLISRFSHNRLGHRFAADQTFEPEEPIEIRVRYRITAEFPLNGELVDPGEMYFKLNNEMLHTFKEDNYDMEIRLSPQLGYVFSDDNKLETGLEYRLSSFINGKARNHVWLKIQWYIRI